MNFYGGGFIPIIIYATYQVGEGSPPVGSGFMLTETTSQRMLTEDGDLMITE
jgi:hypothetical protein